MRTRRKIKTKRPEEQQQRGRNLRSLCFYRVCVKWIPARASLPAALRAWRRWVASSSESTRATITFMWGLELLWARSDRTRRTQQKTEQLKFLQNLKNPILRPLTFLGSFLLRGANTGKDCHLIFWILLFCSSALPLSAKRTSIWTDSTTV